MNKVILVIGSVTAKQYEPVRLELLREGHKPKVVRVTRANFFLNDFDLVEKFQGYDKYPVDFEPEQIYGMAEEHAKSFGDVAVIIMDEHSHIYEWRDLGGAFKQVLEGLAFDRWVAREDGSVEFV